MFNFDINKIAKTTQFSQSHIDEILQPLRDDFNSVYQSLGESNCRYLLLSGGRSATKTNLGGAGFIILESFKQELAYTRFLCLREYAVVLKKSTIGTIKKTIVKYGLKDYFKITDTYILNKITNIEIDFSGCQDPIGLKSIEEVSRCWFEEMENVDYDSIMVISDSIRWESPYNQAKILYTYNPKRPIDDVKKFVYDQEKEDYYEQHITIYDLPDKFVNKSMLKRAETAKKRSKKLWQWAWLGKPKGTISEYPFINTNWEVLENNFTSSIMWIDPSYTGIDTTGVSIIQSNTKGGVDVVGYCFPFAWSDCIKEIVDLYHIHNVQTMIYESNGVGSAPKQKINDEYNIDPLGYPSTTNKEAKITKLPFILDLLSFKVDNNSVYSDISEVYKQQFINYYTKGKNKQHDDAPDSLASLLQHLGEI